MTHNQEAQLNIRRRLALFLALHMEHAFHMQLFSMVSVRTALPP